MTGFGLQVTLHWIGVALYIVSLSAFTHAVVFQHPERVRWGVRAAALGLCPHGSALLLRWQASGHGPYMMKYEVLSSNAWIAIVLLLLLLWSRPGWAAVSVVVMPVSILMIAAGLFSSPEIAEIPPTLRSIWLVFHISFAKLSAGAFLLSLGGAVITLLKSRGVPPGWVARTPDAEVVDSFTVRFIGFGFIFWTVTVAAGAIWANQSWGRYWGWDPIETWSLITWLVYGSFLHVRLFFRLGAFATAWWAAGCFAVFVLTALVLPFLIPSLHSAYFR